MPKTIVLKRPTPAELERLDRPLVDVLDRLGEELAEHAGAVDREGEDSREGAEADGRDEDQRENDLVDAAQARSGSGASGGGRREFGARLRAAKK